jgi:hypothetical protein
LTPIEQCLPASKTGELGNDELLNATADALAIVAGPCRRQLLRQHEGRQIAGEPSPEGRPVHKSPTGHPTEVEGGKRVMFHARTALSSFFLIVAVAIPPATYAQRDDHDHDKNRDHRYYDRQHKDYHTWDAREDQAYRRWVSEEHRKYKDFDRLSKADQQRYWQWRHDHPDAR